MHAVRSWWRRATLPVHPLSTHLPPGCCLLCMLLRALRHLAVGFNAHAAENSQTVQAYASVLVQERTLCL